MRKHDSRHRGDNTSSTAISYSQLCALIHSAITPPKVFSVFFIIDRETERNGREKKLVPVYILRNKEDRVLLRDGNRS